MKNFCNGFLKKYATGIINFEKKETIPLSTEKDKLYLKQELCHICKKKIYH